MDRLPSPRVGDPSARGRSEEPGVAGTRRGLTPSHWVAIGVAVVVVSTVAVIAFVLTRSGDSSPPDGTYRLVARDSALCLTVTGTATSVAPGTPSGVPSPAAPPTGPTVQLSTCPEAGGPLGAAAAAPAAVSGRAPGMGASGVGGDEGTGLGADLGMETDPDGSTGRWTVGTTGGAARRALHPADGTALCLTVTGRTAASPVALEPCRSSGAQTWSLRQVGRSDYFQVVADQGRRCLDAVTMDGAVVAVEKMCSSQPSQQWRFDPAG